MQIHLMVHQCYCTQLYREQCKYIWVIVVRIEMDASNIVIHIHAHIIILFLFWFTLWVLLQYIWTMIVFIFCHSKKLCSVWGYFKLSMIDLKLQVRNFCYTADWNTHNSSNIEISDENRKAQNYWEHPPRGCSSIWPFGWCVCVPYARIMMGQAISVSDMTTPKKCNYMEPLYQLLSTLGYDLSCIGIECQKITEHNWRAKLFWSYTGDIFFLFFSL